MLQFGYVQTILLYHAIPSLSIEENGDRWLQFSEYLAPVGQICSAPRQCAPRHPPMVHDNAFVEPPPAAANVDMSRHAMV